MIYYVTAAVMLAYIGILSIFAYLGYRGTRFTLADYFTAGGAIKAIFIFGASLATAYSAFTFLGGPGYLYTKGIGGAIILSGIAPVTLPLMVLIGRRVWLLARRYNYVTPADLLADRYPSRITRALAAIIVIIFPVFYISVQFIGVGYIMSILTNNLITYEMAVAITGILLGVYIALGGMRGVVWQDTLMAILLATGMAVVAAYGLITVGPNLISKVYEANPDLFKIGNPVSVWTITIGSGLSLAVWPQLWIKFYASRNTKGIWGVGLGEQVGEVFILGLLAILIALAGIVVFPGLSRAEADTITLKFALMLPVIAPFIGIAGISAALSTADSILLSTAGAFTRDIYQKLINPRVSERKATWVGRALAFVVAIFAMIIALSRPGGLVDIVLTLSWPGILILLTPLLGALFWRRATTPGAIASMVLGLIAVVLTTYVWPDPFDVYTGLWGFGAAVVGLVVGSYLSKPPAKEVVSKFHDFLDQIPLPAVKTAEDLEKFSS